MKQLLPDEKVKNQQADEPWTKGDTNKMLDLYFSGVPPERIAVTLKRNPKAINRRIEQLRCNENGYAERYEPLSRLSRRGKRMTENELLFVQAQRKRGIKMKVTARILQREMREIPFEAGVRATLMDMKKIGVGVDLCLAYRFLYYVKSISILPDEAYDELEKEEIEFGAHGEMLKTPGSDNPNDYPPHIRALAMYLAFKYCRRQEEGAAEGA